MHPTRATLQDGTRSLLHGHLRLVKSYCSNYREAGTGLEDEFDLLVIGGGATGPGVALDAVTRGLKVVLVERGDFSSGAPSLLPHLRAPHDIFWSFSHRDIL